MPEGVEESTALINLEERDNAADNIGSEHIGVEEAIACCDAAVAKEANSFIEVGFWLSIIKEKILEMRSYKTIEDFALEKYGFKKAQLYNYIKVWHCFGVLRKDIDGTLKPMIREGYERFSVTKLREMLKLPDDVRSAITSSSTVEDIKKMRKRAKTKSKGNAPSEVEEIEPAEYVETLNAETWEDLAKMVEVLLVQRPSPASGFCLRITFH